MIMKADDFDDWFDCVQPVPGSNADNGESIDGHSVSAALRLDTAAARLLPERGRSRRRSGDRSASGTCSSVGPTE